MQEQKAILNPQLEKHLLQWLDPLAAFVFGEPYVVVGELQKMQISEMTASSLHNQEVLDLSEVTLRGTVQVNSEDIGAIAVLQNRRVGVGGGGGGGGRGGGGGEGIA